MTSTYLQDQSFGVPLSEIVSIHVSKNVSFHFTVGSSGGAGARTNAGGSAGASALTSGPLRVHFDSMAVSLQHHLDPILISLKNNCVALPMSLRFLLSHSLVIAPSFQVGATSV